MQKSVRASCTVPQNPAFDSIGIFVVAMATRMSISKGIEARRVSSPTINIAPHTISTTPTNGAKNCGAGMPILVNRPTPRVAENRNFCILSLTKIPCDQPQMPFPEAKRKALADRGPA